MASYQIQEWRSTGIHLRTLTLSQEMWTLSTWILDDSLHLGKAESVLFASNSKLAPTRLLNVTLQ